MGRCQPRVWNFQKPLKDDMQWLFRLLTPLFGALQRSHHVQRGAHVWYVVVRVAQLNLEHMHSDGTLGGHREAASILSPPGHVDSAGGVLTALPGIHMAQ